MDASSYACLSPSLLSFNQWSHYRWPGGLQVKNWTIIHHSYDTILTNYNIAIEQRFMWKQTIVCHISHLISLCRVNICSPKLKLDMQLGQVWIWITFIMRISNYAYAIYNLCIMLWVLHKLKFPRCCTLVRTSQSMQLHLHIGRWTLKLHSEKSDSHELHLIINVLIEIFIQDRNCETQRWQ